MPRNEIWLRRPVSTTPGIQLPSCSTWARSIPSPLRVWRGAVSSHALSRAVPQARQVVLGPSCHWRSASRLLERLSHPHHSTREGIALAKKAGVYRGRKPSLTDEQAQDLRKRVAAGEKKAGLAREFGVSRETLYQYLRA